MQGRAASEREDHLKRIAELEDELSRQMQQSHYKEDNIANLQATVDQFREKCFYLEEDLNNKMQEINLMKQDIERFEIEQLAGTGEVGSKFGGVSLSALRIESEQLRKDNAKLLNLLSKTKEYENFGNFVDNLGGNAVRIQTGKENQQEEANEDIKPDEDEWVPGEAFATAYQFRSKHGNDMTPDLINQLLSNLNKIWQDREKKQINRINKKNQEEITQLKRQLISRTPYDALQAKKQISRLTTELSQTKKELAKFQKQKVTNEKNPVGTELIDNTL